MNRADLNRVTWRKSSYSNGQSSCVEVSDDFPETVPVRDSKDPHGPALTFSAGDWSSFVTALKGGAFHR
ncbi:DUF397 domain-containing protein [Streptomyces sp. WZ-12]|uniref:DUF397 domain-containing protein n=1 Tax=Streptomyces sp. WZ-12 TaxID=3030210 RepID=UPI002380F77B|nr:DUF397 domain-containing protein [Streptomyces sp. WZ-12]